MRKNVWYWAMYDFANSIIMIVFLFYFSQWLVVDRGMPDWWYNMTLIVSSLLFIIVAPFLAHRVDVTGEKLPGVRITTVTMFILYFMTAVVMLFFPTQALLATIFFTLAMTIYLLSFIYYTPMINDISTNEDRGWVSGLGMGANYLGQVFGLLATLPFATGAIYLFGAPGRAQTLVPALIFSIIFAIPLLIWFKVKTRLNGGRSGSWHEKWFEQYKSIWYTVKRIFALRNLVLVLIAYFLFSDALLTFSNNFPIYLEKVFGAGDSTKSYLTAGILLLSAIGSFIFGKITDRLGTKKTLVWILVTWIILFPLLAYSVSFTMASIVCLFAGLFFGPIWGVSRAMISEHSPREIEASSFGIYTLAERFATFVGPITWSLVLARTASQGSISYSYAILSMGVLVLISLLFILLIDSRRISWR